MMHVAYLLILLVALGCLSLIDRRYGLALFAECRRTVLVLLTGTIFFLIWDIIGVDLRIFFIGDSRYLTGITVLPEVPLEELFFLLLLNYNALLLWRGGEKLWPRT